MPVDTDEQSPPAEPADEDFFERAKAAVAEERLRQSRDLLSGERSHFDDGALAFAALAELENPPARLLLPLAQLVAHAEQEQLRRWGDDQASAEDHAGWIAHAWKAIVDAVLEERAAAALVAPAAATVDEAPSPLADEQAASAEPAPDPRLEAAE